MVGIKIRISAHSTRSASPSAAATAGVPLQTILEAAGWTQESTFSHFFKKHTHSNFEQSLLDSYINKSKHH